MKNLKNIPIELNEKELFNLIEFSKTEKIKPYNLKIKSKKYQKI